MITVSSQQANVKPIRKSMIWLNMIYLKVKNQFKTFQQLLNAKFKSKTKSLILLLGNGKTFEKFYIPFKSC